MPISSQNMIVLYREDSDDSYSFATYYADAYNIDYSQLVAVPCSGDEILADYATFQAQIENAVVSALASEYLSADIQIILVGYGVPGGFRDGSDVISITSRLSRVNHIYEKGMSNPLFSRQIFKRFDDIDAQTALIVSRIDAPTLDAATTIVKNIKLVARQGVANGKLYFDPYAEIDGTHEQDYQNELFDFETQLLPILNIPEYRTTFWNAQTDVVIPKLSGDSFMWAWKADRAGFTFFLDKTTSRIFQYNADTDGAASVRDPTDKRWPMLALNAGYATTAGSMSDPLPEGFLRPKPFFDALLRGATIGEAFMFAVPNFDWTVTLFGDPLITTRFPSAAVVVDGLTSESGFDTMGRNIDNIIGYYLQREQAFIDIYNTLRLSNDVETVTELLTPFTSLANDVIAQTPTDLGKLVSQYVAFPDISTVQTFPQFLQAQGFQVSSLISVIAPTIQIPVLFQYPFGYWDFTADIQHPTSEFHTYQFQIQLANDAAFTQLINTGFSFTAIDNAVVNGDSSQSVVQWLYEKDSNVFSAMSANGVISSYAGRRVRYIPTAAEYFQSRQVYYIRIRQLDEFGDPTAWVSSKQVVGT